MFRLLGVLSSHTVKYDMKDQKMVLGKRFDMVRFVFAFVLSLASIFVSSGLGAGFLFSVLLFQIPAAILGVLLGNYIFQSEVDRLNNDVTPPHKVLDSFLKWEEGDTIKMKHFIGVYKGVTQNHKVIFENNGWGFTLSVEYLNHYLLKNEDLEERELEQVQESIQNEIEDENGYDEFLETCREEYKKMSS